MKISEDISEVEVKSRKTYYKGYQRKLELSCSTLYIEYIDILNYYNLMTKSCNEL